MSEAELPKKRKAGLGRGLSALLGEIEQASTVAVPVTPIADAPPSGEAAALPDGVRMAEIFKVRPMPDQPRKNFHDEPLEELAASIKTHGILQPIVVRALDDHFQIVAGERRWRAAQIAQLHHIPIIVRDFDDRTALEIALVENLQREALDFWEEGETYRRLVDDLGYSQDEVAKAVSKSRSHVSNLIRIRNHLTLHTHAWIMRGELSMGHARALLLCDDPEALAREVIERRLNVRETEALAKNFKPGASKRRREVASATRDADLIALEKHLGESLGLKVRIAHKGRGGSVALTYSTLDQLDLICQRLSGEKI